MRGLSESFIHNLESGFLSGIIEAVRGDPDLNLEIRDSYVNIYYKGNSLLKLAEVGLPPIYATDIHSKFLEGVKVEQVLTESSVPSFLQSIPALKANIIKYGRNSLELEYEQLVIRANNREHRNNTEYFVVDRQYQVEEGRFDLSGIFWGTRGRRKGQEVPICFMEIKFALNNDIRDLHEQLERYYQPIARDASRIAEEMETVFRQKLSLGLYDQPRDRVEAMKTLKFSRVVDSFQFILVLVDYNRNASLLDLDSLGRLPFAAQIKVFHTGFGMWSHNVFDLTELLKAART